MLKPHLKKILSLLALITITVPSLRAEEDYDGEIFSANNISYTIISTKDGTCRTTIGSEENPRHSYINGELIIPSTVVHTKNGNQYTVIEIGNYSFYKSFISSLKLPETLRIIGDFAFSECPLLAGSLVIPESVTEIGKNAFFNCKKLSGDLIIPSSVTTIREHTFDGCGFSGNLTIGGSVTTIGDYAFNGCKNLSGDLTLGERITKIGDYAFNGCTSFNGNLTIGESVTKIGNYAFYGCTGFNGDLTIGESVTKIGNYAFYGCTGFTGNLNILSENTYIGSRAFSGCKGFAGELTLTDKVASLGDYAFADCTGLQMVDLNIDGPLTHIGEGAFTGCYGIKNITIGDNVTSIGASAFKNALYVTSVSLGESISKIDKDAFYNTSIKKLNLNFELKDWLNIDFENEDSNPIRELDISDVRFSNVTLKEWVLPDGIEVIKPFMFCRARVLMGELKIPDSVVTIGSHAFYMCKLLEGPLYIPDSVETIGDNAFSNCIKLTELNIGKSVKTIGNDAFNYCIGLTGKLNLPESLSTIGQFAFRECEKLTGDLIIPNSVTEIGSSAFQNCSNLSGNLTIGNSVSKIGAYAFNGCKGFNGTITIGKSVSIIGIRAFQFSEEPFKVKRIVSLPKEIPYIDAGSVNPGPFGDKNSWDKSTPIIVPQNAVEEYRNDVFWKYFNVDGIDCPVISLVPSKDNPNPIHVNDEAFYEASISFLNDPEAPEEIVSDLYYDISSSKNAMEFISQDNNTYKLKAVHFGDAVFSVKSDLFDILAEINIHVEAIPVYQFTLSSLSMENKKDKHNLKPGESIYFTVNIEPQEADYDEIIWSIEPNGASFEITDDGEGKSVIFTFNEDCDMGDYIIKAQIDDSEVNIPYPINIEELILGDANDNGDVTLADAITIANEVLVQDTNTESGNRNFCFINSDVNKDKELTCVDLTATINIAMELSPFPESESLLYSTRSGLTDDVSPNIYFDNFSEGDNLIGVTLENAENFVSLMIDIYIPENMEIISVTGGEGLANHSVNYNYSDNKLRVLIYSLSNECFKANNMPLFTLKAKASSICNNLSFGDARAVDIKMRETSISVSGGNMGGTTAIDGIENSGNNLPIDIYDISGKLVKSLVNPTEVDNLKPGLYIVRRGKDSQKILVK